MKFWIALLNLSIVTAVLGCFLGCSTKSANNTASLKDSPIEQTLDSALRHFTYDALDSSVFNHFNFYPDEFRDLSASILASDVMADSTLDISIRTLCWELEPKITDSVSFAFRDKYKFGSNVIVEGDITEVARVISDEHLSQKYFGSLNLSDPVFLKDRQWSAYYFALNCYLVVEEGCTFSAAVFCKWENEKWVIKHLSDITPIYSKPRFQHKTS